MKPPFKIDEETRGRIAGVWPAFQERRRRMLEARDCGRVLHERDVEELFRSLAEGPLGYGVEHLEVQQDYADYALVNRGLKLAIVEIKALGYLQGGQEERAEDVLRQAARYAHRHRTPHLMAFDGDTLILARWERSVRQILCNLVLSVDRPEPPEELFYFTQYGLFRAPGDALFAMSFVPELDEELVKLHHGVRLPYTCFAYVGDLRSKQTWKLPFRNADGTVDTKRLGHAVNFLLSPGGYRGQRAESDSVPLAATTLVALRLAQAYKELARWQAPQTLFEPGDKPSPQELLWTFLYQQGIEDLPEVEAGAQPGS
jgi:hypothetical protein